MILWSVKKIDITEYAGPSEFVLILKICAIRILQHYYSKPVASVHQLSGDIELRRTVGHFAVADKYTVEIYKVCGIYTFEIEIVFPSVLLRCSKIHRIDTCRIICRNIWRIIRNRVIHVRILVLYVSEKLQAGWNGNLIHRRGVIITSDHLIINIFRRWEEPELPFSRKKGLCTLSISIHRHVICSASLRTDMLYGKVLIILLKLHGPDTSTSIPIRKCHYGKRICPVAIDFV